MAVSVNNRLVQGGAGANQFLKTITFTGAAGLGAVGTVTVGTVTGAILVTRIIAYCSTLLGVDAGTGAASIALGVTGATTAFVTTTTATDIDAGEFWTSATPTANTVAVPAAGLDIATGQNIIATVTSSGTQIINSGVLNFLVEWLPITPNGGLS